MNLKKNGKVFTSKSVGTGPSSCEKRIYRAAVSQKFRNTGQEQQTDGTHRAVHLHHTPLPLSLKKKKFSLHRSS